MLFKRLKARLKRAEEEICMIKNQLFSLREAGSAYPSDKDVSDCAALIDEWINGGARDEQS